MAQRITVFLDELKNVYDTLMKLCAMYIREVDGNPIDEQTDVQKDFLDYLKEARDDEGASILNKLNAEIKRRLYGKLTIHEDLSKSKYVNKVLSCFIENCVGGERYCYKPRSQRTPLQVTEHSWYFYLPNIDNIGTFSNTLIEFEQHN